MPSRWWKLQLRIPAWLEDPMVLFLTEQGIPGLQVVEEGPTQALIAYLCQAVSIDGLKEKVHVYCRALERVHGIAVDFDWEVNPIIGEDWQEAWKAHFQPLRASPRIVVKPTWEIYRPPDGVVTLEIDPGQAFGTGQHPTTRMCLAWIDRRLDGREGTPPLTALDVGTGSGILAIAMAKLGVKEVWAIDTDPLATEAARVNASINEVEDQVVVVEGSLDALTGRAFPLVVANLTGPLLLKLSEAFGRCVTGGGWLILSGVLDEEKRALLKSLRRLGFNPAGESHQESWCALSLKRRA